MTITAKRPDQLVSILSTDFARRNEPQLAWKSACSAFQALPGLVGFWPMSSVQRSTGNAYDLSGQARALTYNGNPTYNYTGTGAPYVDLDGVGDYLSRADETDLDILGTETIYAAAVRGLTIGGWFYVNSTAAAAIYMGKSITAGNQRGYKLEFTATQNRFLVSTDGIAEVTVVSGALPATGAWQFTAGRFTPSTEVKLWINNTTFTNVAGIPASIFNNTSAFAIGATGAGTSPLTGRASMCFLCADLLSDTVVSMLYQQTRSMYGV